MPIYDWECPKCKQKKELFKKTFDEYRDPPTAEEADACTEGEHNWQKVMGIYRVVKAPGFGSKGNW